MGKTNQTTLKNALAIAFAALLISLAMAQVVLADTQTWYLRSDTSGSARIMYKSGGATSTVNIASGTPVIWRAENPANPDAGFTTDNWTGILRARTFFSSTNVTLEIGSWDGAAFTSAGTSNTLNYGNTATNQAFTITPGSFTVSTGDWLALRITSTGTWLQVTTDGAGKNYSYLDSPSSDPGYPVPDMGAVIMFAAGLGIIGWIILRFRRNRPSRRLYQMK